MNLQQLRSKSSQPLVPSVLALAVGPALCASSWAGRALQLPVRIAVACLQLAESVICAELACLKLIKQPGSRAQIGTYQQKGLCLAAARQEPAACSPAATKVSWMRCCWRSARCRLATYGALCRVSQQLVDKVQSLQQQLAMLEAAAAAAAGTGAPALHQKQPHPSVHSSSSSGGVMCTTSRTSTAGTCMRACCLRCLLRSGSCCTWPTRCNTK